MYNKLKTKSKTGFSLFEVCVTMAIVVIFIAAGTNVFTQKFKRRVSLPAHGHYECYYDNSGNLKQQMFSGENKLQDNIVAEGEYCYFQPPKTAAYIIITAVGAGGHGGPVYGGSAGEYTNSFISGTTHRMEILPGKAAASVTDSSGETVVYDVGESGDLPKVEPMIRKLGGRNDSSTSLWLKDCRITYAEKSCYITPYCTLYNDEKYAEIDYCAKNDDTGEDSESEKTVRINYMGAASSPPPIFTVSPDAEGGISYDYSDEYGNYMFTFVVEIDGNYTEFQEKTPLEGYIKSLKLNDLPDSIGKLAIPPGTGGAKGAKGGDGAVLITW